MGRVIEGAPTGGADFFSRLLLAQAERYDQEAQQYRNLRLLEEVSDREKFKGSVVGLFSKQEAERKAREAASTKGGKGGAIGGVAGGATGAIIGGLLAVPTGGLSVAAGAALGGSIGGSAGSALGTAIDPPRPGGPDYSQAYGAGDIGLDTYSRWFSLFERNPLKTATAGTMLPPTATAGTTGAGGTWPPPADLGLY